MQPEVSKQLSNKAKSLGKREVVRKNSALLSCRVHKHIRVAWCFTGNSESALQRTSRKADGATRTRLGLNVVAESLEVQPLVAPHVVAIVPHYLRYLYRTHQKSVRRHVGGL